jgi:hypothetical protein
VRGKTRRYSDRIVVEYGRAIVFALGELHAAPTENIDRGYEFKFCHRWTHRVNAEWAVWRPRTPLPTARAQRRSTIVFHHRGSVER